MSTPPTRTREAPVVRGDGVVLAPWRDDDAPGVVEIAADPVTQAWSFSMRLVHSVDDARRWMSQRSANDDRVDWAVRDATSGVLVGRVGMHRFDSESGNAEIGYGVHPAHRRRGVALAAVTAATSYGFSDLGLTRISLIHAVGNAASCRVAAAAGYAFEGIERASLDHGDGVLHDAHRHARLATDPPGGAQPAPEPVATKAIEPVEIAAGRYQLRPPDESDAADALALLRDPDVALWNPGGPGPDGLDLEEARAWCRRAGDWSSGEHATFSVLDATTGRLLGNVALHQIDHEQADAEIGYRVAPWARGQGVATAAVAAATRWAFGALDLLRIELCHAVVNPASCRVAEKAGYPLEGTLRQSYVYGDGRRYDEHLHARLVTDSDPR